MPPCANRPGRSEVHPGYKGRRQLSRAHEQKGNHQKQERDGARDDNALCTRPSKAEVSDRRPPLLPQQKSLGRRSGSDDQHANENPPLPTVALEDGRRPMEKAEDQEQAHYQPNPGGAPLNPGCGELR